MDPEQLIDMQFDQYVIEEHIAHSNIADVFLARDINLNRKVALKILLNTPTQDEQFIDRFRREAQIFARLDYPNIVQVYSTGSTPSGQPYIATQYIRGGSLRDLLKRWEVEGKVAPTSQSLAVIRHIASALTVAHQQGIVHRDLKPSNVLIRSNGMPVLVDFGIAITEGGERITQSGSIIGTPHYMSPEQVRGGKVDGRSDIYSLGVILYEMLAGFRPFDGDETLAILHKQVYETPTPIEHLRSGLSAATIQVVNTCLQKDPGLRYQTADDVVNAIDNALLAEGTQGHLLKTTILLPEGQAELLIRSRLRPGSIPPGSIPPGSVLAPSPAPTPAKRSKDLLSFLTLLIALAVTISGIYLSITENLNTALPLIVAALFTIGGFVFGYLAFAKENAPEGFYKSSRANEIYYPKRYKYGNRRWPLLGISIILFFTAVTLVVIEIMQASGGISGTQP